MTYATLYRISALLLASTISKSILKAEIAFHHPHRREATSGGYSAETLSGLFSAGANGVYTSKPAHHSTCPSCHTIFQNATPFLCYVSPATDMLI